MTYRPDELANRADIERDARTRSNVKKGVGLAASIGAGLAYGPSAQKLLPYLSGSVPVNLAMKYIKKFSPKTAEFLNRGRDLGLDIQEGMDFVKDKLGTKPTEKSQNLFQRLIGDVDVSSLSEGLQKQLGFLAPIAAQLESKGKDENDPAVKKLKNKIMKILGGKQGFLEKQAMEADLGSIAEKMAPMMQQPGAQMEQPQQGQMSPEQMPQGQGQQQMGPGAQALMAQLQRIQAARGAGG